MIHRDDLPFEEAEKIVKMLQEKHPGHEVVFMGDHAAEVPPEVKRHFDELTKAMREKFLAGKCDDCATPMPGWTGMPPKSSSELPAGWEFCECIGLPDQQPGIWLCPECSKDEEIGNDPTRDV